MAGFLLCLVGVVVGAVLLWRGRGMRLVPGVERRCATCGYMLRGITSERCPECGSPTRDAIYGEMKRKWDLLGWGAIIGLASLYGLASNWDRPLHEPTWYRTAPSRVLLWQQHYRQLNVNNACWKELAKRVDNETLSQQQALVVCDAALAAVQASIPTAAASQIGVNREAIGCLLRLAASGRLDSVRAGKACDTAVQLLSVSAKGERYSRPAVHVTSDFDIFGPYARLGSGMWFEMRAEYLVGGQPCQPRRSAFTASFPTGLTYGDEVAAPGAGEHLVSIKYQFDLYTGPQGDFTRSRKIGTCRRTATTQCVVPPTLATKPAAHPTR